MNNPLFGDWGEASEAFDQLKAFISERDITQENEAQTRFDVIDRLIREVLGWKFGQINVEEYSDGEKQGYVDYLLRQGDFVIIIEAKRAGLAFPSPTKKPKLKLNGTVLGEGAIAKALTQAEEYAVVKNAQVVVVTNGLCWCFYSRLNRTDDDFGTLLFPFQASGHAEELYRIFSVKAVESGSLERITNALSPVENRLITAFKFDGARVDRNSIADHIMPALNTALYADALLSDNSSLRYCYVATEDRAKFDKQLGMHLADPKSEMIKPAYRIKRGKEHGHLEQIVETSISSHAPPVTLIIGPVGVGKSTYLKHFETISGEQVLQHRKVHWIYINFAQMGTSDDPRKFIYESLRTYLLAEHPNNPTSYKTTIEPAYAEEVQALTRGPFAILYNNNREEYKKKISEYIENDFHAVEPYVDKIMRFLSKSCLCVVVLDNVDLYENEKLETQVFSEGLALSKRVFCNVIVSIRDTTFVRHQNDSTFNAYELRKLWLDPPPFKAILSRRLSYSKKILQNHSAKISLSNGMKLDIPDLSVFFDIVQRSILYDQAGEYIEAMADLNIRKGLTMVSSFLTSGHVNGDRAIKIYLDGDHTYRFPFHEVVKGTMFGQWRHFREERSDGVNLFDARLGARTTRLLRLLLLNFLLNRARSDETMETHIGECFQIFTRCGASPEQIVFCLGVLQKRGLVRDVVPQDINENSTITLTRTGGFYVQSLSHRYVYIEECMFDTAIEHPDVWRSLTELTTAIEGRSDILERLKIRRDRIVYFLDYLQDLEAETLELTGYTDQLASIASIKKSVFKEANDAILKTARRNAYS